jgi:hypothetical protein
MSPGRLNALVFAGIVLLIGVNGAAFSYRLLGSGLNHMWTTLEGAYAKTSREGGRSHDFECLGVSDFYSVHLTRHIPAGLEESAGG